MKVSPLTRSRNMPSVLLNRDIPLHGTESIPVLPWPNRTNGHSDRQLQVLRVYGHSRV